MTASDLLALIWFISVIGIFIFTISAIINLFRKQSSKGDWKKVLVFFILSTVFLILFGLVH
jgi:magnesium-transporting ATPase (P-type)